MADITFRNVKAEISVNGGGAWTNISGKTNKLGVDGGEREIGTFFDALSDVPSLGAGKRSEIELTLTVKYTENDAEAHGILRQAYENATETLFRWSPLGGAQGTFLFTSTAGFVKSCPYVGQEVESGDALRTDFTIIVPSIVKSVVP